MENKEYYESLDKRTKEYREWKKKQQAIGLGDVVEKFTEATGIKKVVKALWGESCGCDERKEKLNKMFSYRKTECLEEAEYNYLVDFYARHKGSYLAGADKMCLIKIHNRVFHTNYNKGTSCSKCVKTVFTNLKRLLDNYA